MYRSQNVLEYYTLKEIEEVKGSSLFWSWHLIHGKY